MRIVIQGQDVAIQWAEVSLSTRKIARQFTLKETADTPTWNVGDMVHIYAPSGTLLLEGEIEVFKTSQERGYVYAGRSRAKYAVDCYLTETIQFTEGQGIQDILTRLLSSFALQFKGDIPLAKHTVFTYGIGSTLEHVFWSLNRNTGHMFVSDAQGNIEVLSKPKKSNTKLVYGENIRSRSLVVDTTKEYDTYVVFSQNNFLDDENTAVSIQGSYGDGAFVKAEEAYGSLSEQECKTLAQKMFENDRKASFAYTVELDATLDVALHTICSVSDDVLHIAEDLVVRDITYTMSDEISKMVCVLEKQ